MNSRQERTFIFGLEEHEQYRSVHSSSGSSCSSCCDYSDDSIPEWDSCVLENGELFFIKCSPIIRGVDSTERKPKTNISRSKSNKLSTFLRKRKPKKHSKGVNVTRAEKNETSRAAVKAESSGINESEDLSEHSVAVLFLNVGSIEPSESGISDTLYHFPQSSDKNVVNLIKGALITLYHLLPKLVSEKPESSTIFIKDELVHLVYIGEEKRLMILACPQKNCSLFELKQLGLSVRHCLNFKYRSLHDCFSNPMNHTNLNQFFGNIFIKLLRDNRNVPNLENSEDDMAGHEIQAQFEDTFVFPCLLVIPHNLEMKIHEKLNEIEANDFGDLSEDHYGCQRLFTIIGTCLYYKGNLIATHLSRDDLLDVHSFLRLNDILDLTVTSIIESLVIWQEVYPSSSSHNQDQSRSYGINRRWFLLVIGKDQGLLATLLESGGCSVNNVGPSKPDELYVEQIQDSLSDILHLGLSDAVEQSMRRSNSNSVSSQKTTPYKSGDGLANTGSVCNLSRKSNDFASSLNFDNDTASSHHSSAPPANGNYEDMFSESLNRTTSSVFSDDTIPVLGRRAQRLQQLNNAGSVFTLSQSNLSDSDRSDYDTTGSSHSSSLVDGCRRFLKDPTCSKRIIHGDEKALFYYVNLHTNRGVILYSVNAQHSDVARRCQSIINNFKLSAQKIHTVLSQKKVPSVGKFQRNTMPVKEYGILFEYCGAEEDEKKSARTSYWIVGRTFSRPQLGEVYVCYEDRTPQNLVEIAFRLAMSA